MKINQEAREQHDDNFYEEALFFENCFDSTCEKLEKSEGFTAAMYRQHANFKKARGYAYPMR